MHFHRAFTALALCFAISSTLASTSSEIRDFIDTTGLMDKFGMRIATSLTNRSRNDLLLGIQPSSLILMTDDFQFSPQKETHSTTPRSRLISIADKLLDLKLICVNEKVQRHFSEWGIMELCKGESQQLFLSYFRKLFKRKSHLVMAKGDLDDSPIVELGILSCMKLQGPCASSRPNDTEVASILASEEPIAFVTSTTTIPVTSDLTTKLSSEMVTIVVTITSFLKVSSISSESLAQSLPTTTKIPTLDAFPTPKTPISSSRIETKSSSCNFDSLDKPPVYKDDPLAFESYRSMLKIKLSVSTSTRPGVLWVNFAPPPTSTRIKTVTKVVSKKNPKKHTTLMKEDYFGAD